MQRGRSPLNSGVQGTPCSARDSPRLHSARVQPNVGSFHSSLRYNKNGRSKKGFKLARKAREYCESNLYNAGIKGHNSQLLFFDDEDRLHFLKAIFLACEEFEVGLAAWTLMNNHAHFFSITKLKPCLHSLSRLEPAILNG